MSIAKDIILGKHDTEISQIMEAVRERQKLVRSTENAIALSEIDIGSKVKLKNIRPKYMNGEVATILGKKRTKFSAKLDVPTERFPGIFTISASCVELV
jgi:hypothetical protein